MDRRLTTRTAMATGIPHTRGDGPHLRSGKGTSPWYSPHTWGWTAGYPPLMCRSLVFPTHVGMDRGSSSRSMTPACIPHTRGDGPLFVMISRFILKYSPHTWGWTVAQKYRFADKTVFPTHVGMDRIFTHAPPRNLSIPHTRGDGPVSQAVRCCCWKYSPHTWGWTARLIGARVTTRVFPTHVGMDRSRSTRPASWSCIPHTRGDGPSVRRRRRHRKAYSPHTWGWTANRHTIAKQTLVFPTHVGMDRFAYMVNVCKGRIPHTRGDGPFKTSCWLMSHQYSPHTWGWTEETRRGVVTKLVFPTHVGMDRIWNVPGTRTESIPHTRGDGPETK